MAATTTLSSSTSPPSLFLPKHTHFKNTSFASDSFPDSKSFLFRGFVTKKLAFRRRTNWVTKTMNQSTEVSAFTDDDEESDENIHVFEQEAFIDESSRFRLKFLSSEMEYKLNKMSKWIVAALFSFLILWRHDAEALWFAAGSVLNTLLCVSLKRILNQERPSTLKSDPGMPSSHAQSIFFTVFFIILSSVEWLGLNVFTIFTSVLALAFGSFFSYLRVSQQLHTISQVVVGAVIGSTFTVLWYWLWNTFVLDAFASFLWVRIIVVLGSAGFCLGFVIYALCHWLKDD